MEKRSRLFPTSSSEDIASPGDFVDGPEILFLISDLSHNANAVSFISHFGCEEYFRFNKKLKFQEERQNLLQEIDSVIRTV